MKEEEENDEGGEEIWEAYGRLKRGGAN